LRWLRMIPPTPSGGKGVGAVACQQRSPAVTADTRVLPGPWRTPTPDFAIGSGDQSSGAKMA
jgi:hypothetical protein